LPVIPAPVLTPEDEIIGNTVAEFIEDESTVQLGIGGMPNAVGYALKTKHDLGNILAEIPCLNVIPYRTQTIRL